MNAFQNAQLPMPKLRAERHVSRHVSRFLVRLELTMISEKNVIFGEGMNAKEAQNHAALEGCRAIAKAGLLVRQVSDKQKTKGSKGSKGKKHSKAMERRAQAELAQGPAGAPAFVLPFAVPCFNGANPAKKVQLMNNGKVPMISLSAAGLDSLAKAAGCRWARIQPHVPPRPYQELMALLSSGQPFVGHLTAPAVAWQDDPVAAPRDAADSKKWFYLDASGKEQGPFAAAQLRLWHEQMADRFHNQVQVRSESGRGTLHKNKWVALRESALLGGTGGVDEKGEEETDGEPAAKKARRANQWDAMTAVKPASGVCEPASPAWPAASVAQQQLLRNSRLSSSPQVQVILEKRQKLPVFGRRADVVAATLDNGCTVSVIGGETGSGKTTQVPQFIMDELIDRNSGGLPTGLGGGQVVVTQPRRLAAISVARRVAEERGEQLGESVGYEIALESVLPTAPCQVMFCTTGVLLRRMSSGPGGLDGVVHIVVDEVHERDLSTDFLLVLVNRLVKVAPRLRVTLMSATLDAKLFAHYFARGGVRGAAVTFQVPVLQVEGKMFPVQEMHLEEALQHMGEALRDAPVPTRKQTQVDDFGGDQEDGPEVSQQLLEDAGRRAGAMAGFLQGPHCENEEASPSLVAAVICWLALADPLKPPPGVGAAEGFGDGAAASAVLVFLPGTQEIRDVEQALAEPPFRKMLGGKVLVLPLHRSLSSEEQGRVFNPPPAGMQKVILATNVAESSVTIDDVAYVVNSGKLKERRFHATSGVSTLQSHWASAANNKQRRGRAGRVRPGMCIHLFVHGRQQRLQPFQTPEMLRVPLDELCLTIKALELGKVAPVLAEALEPPEATAVAAAIASLTGIGALDAQENLTPLGRSLAQLPLEPRVGKMLILAASLGVLGVPCPSQPLRSKTRLSHKKAEEGKFSWDSGNFVNVIRIPRRHFQIGLFV
jgi:HrpA-like RNA helicase